jgi:CheY-like chemotaxis protein
MTSLQRVIEIPLNPLIIVVEDDVFERMGASCMFLDAGYRVLDSENAEAALQIFETNADIGLLFSDVSLPGLISGSDLARQVAERWPSVGIIIASGRPRPPGLSLSIRFHDKPYDPSAVLQHANEIMVFRTAEKEAGGGRDRNGSNGDMPCVEMRKPPTEAASI